MTVHNWEGKALDVKQADTITVAGTWAQNDTVTITCDGLDFVVTIGTLVTTAEVAATIKQAFGGETLTDTDASYSPAMTSGARAFGQFAEVTATVSGSVVTLTASSTVGKPFTFTVTENTAGTGTATLANSIAARGRHEGDNADNFSGGAILADGDTLNLIDGDIDLLYDLNFACQLAAINKSREYTGRAGLPITNRDNSSLPYTEYRTPLYATTDDNIATTTANLETGPKGRGSSRFKWDFGAGQFLVNVFGRGTRELTGVPCILLKGTHASNELNNLAGDVGVAFYPGETSTLVTVRHGDGPQSVAETVLGSGVTLSGATITINGGKLESNSAAATVNQNGGEHSHKLGTITAHNCQEGVFKVIGAVTVTTQTIGPRGTVDLRAGTGTVVFTNPIQMSKGAKFYDPAGRSGNPVFVLNRCNLEDVTIVLPNGKTYTTS